MLGDELKKARLKAGLTQEQVAVRARISREYVSKLEHGRQSPTVDMLLRVCRILGTRASGVLAKVEATMVSSGPRGLTIGRTDPNAVTPQPSRRRGTD